MRNAYHKVLNFGNLRWIRRTSKKCKLHHIRNWEDPHLSAHEKQGHKFINRCRRSFTQTHTHLMFRKVFQGIQWIIRNTDENPISFGNVRKFIYMGVTATHQNYIHEDIKNRLNSGNSWKLKVLYGCETLSLNLSSERRLRESESSILERIFGSKQQEAGKTCIMSVVVYTFH
jgi:hypothetical protein